jgi:hypothetical protein
MVEVQRSSSGSQNPSQPLAIRDREEAPVDATSKEAPVLVATPTTTRTTSMDVEVIATHTAASATSETTILPFHMTVTEYCNHGEMAVKGLWVTGRIKKDIDLWPGLVVSVVHLVPHFPPIQVGAYDYKQSRLRYGYFNDPTKCEWYDDETWKTCGECRAALWSGPPLNCAAGHFDYRASLDP